MVNAYGYGNHFFCSDIVYKRQMKNKKENKNATKFLKHFHIVLIRFGERLHLVVTRRRSGFVGLGNHVLYSSEGLSMRDT